MHAEETLVKLCNRHELNLWFERLGLIVAASVELSCWKIDLSSVKHVFMPRSIQCAGSWKIGRLNAQGKSGLTLLTLQVHSTEFYVAK